MVTTLSDSVVVTDSAPLITATCKELLNDLHELQFSTTADSEEAGLITEECYAVTRIGEQWREFSINSVTESDADELLKDVTASLSSVELADIVLENAVTGTDPEVILGNMLKGTRWTVGTVEGGIVDRAFTEDVQFMTVLEAIFTLQSAFNCDVHFSYQVDGSKVIKRQVNLYARLGATEGKRFEIDKDITSIERAIDTTQLATAIYPINKQDVDGKTVITDISTLEWKKSAGKPTDKPKGEKLIINQDALEQWGRIGNDGKLVNRVKLYEFNEDVTIEQMAQMSWVNLGKYITPKVTYTANVIDLYSLLGTDYTHEKMSLGDTATIIDRNFSVPIVTESRVIELNRNLLDPTDSEVVLGYAVADFASNRNRTDSAIKDALDAANTANQNASLAQASADGKNTNYYGSIEPSKPHTGDIWFRPNPDNPEETQLLRWDGVQWIVELDTAEFVIPEAELEEIRQAAEEAKAAGENAANLATQAQVDADSALDKANAIEINVSGVLQDVADINIDLSGMYDAIADNVTAIADAQSVASDAYAKANALDTSVGQLVIDTTAMSTAITENADAITNAQSVASDAYDKAVANGGAINTLETTVDGQTQTIATVKTTADSALSKANVTETTVDGMQTTLTQTKTTADSALSKANTAQSTADGNASTISTVKTTANTALNTANTAKSTADGNTSKITAVTTTANSALSKANVLEETVDGVSRTITSVQEDLNNLSGRNLLIRTGEQVNKGLHGNGANPGTTSVTYPVPADLAGVSTMLEAIKVTAGKKYTFQKSGTGYWRFNWLDKDYAFLSRSIPTETKYTATAPNNAEYLWVSYPTNAEVKIEEGSIATGFSLAPEDTPTVTQINTISDTVDGHTQLIATTKTTADSALSKANVAQSTADGNTTKITATTTTANNALSKANTLEQTVDGVTQTISSVETDLTATTKKVNEVSTTVDGQTQTIASVKTTADSALSKSNTLETTVDGMKTTLTATKSTADSALSKANSAQSTADGNTSTISSVKTTANTALSTANTAKSTADGNTSKITAVTTTANNALNKATTVEETVNGVKTTVSSLESTVSNISNGGANMVSNGGFENGFTGWTSPSGFTVDTSIYHSGSKSLKISNFGNIGRAIGLIANVPVIPGRKYEVSYWYKTTEDADGVAGNQKLRIGNSSGTLINGLGWDGAQTEWAQKTQIYTAGSNTYTWRITLVAGHRAGTVWWDDVSIVDVTDREETNAKITQVETTVDGVKTTVASVKTTADSALSKATTTETTVNGLKTTVSDVQTTANSAMTKATQVEQTASSIQSTVVSVQNDLAGVNAANNLIDSTFTFSNNADININSGEVGSGSRTIINEFVPVEPNTRYTFYRPETRGTFGFRCYREDKSYIGATAKLSESTRTADFIAPNGCYFIKFIDESNKLTKGYSISVSTATASQITQLSDTINLKVAKNDVVNQINVSTESILIAGNKVQITGQTYIENAVIKTAHIVDLAVSTAKIANLAVGTAKIADGAIVNAKIGDAAINNAKIQDATITSAKIVSLDAGKVTASTLSAITSNTGTLNVTGWINIQTDNNGIRANYDYGDQLDGTYNPRWFTGEYVLGYRYHKFLADVYNLNSNGSKGTFKNYAETFVGGDYFKLRQYNNKTDKSLLGRIDMTGGKLEINDSWHDGTETGIHLYGDGRSWFEQYATFSNGMYVGATNGGKAIETGRIDAPSNYDTLKLNNNRALNDVTFGELNTYFNETRLSSADFRIGVDGDGRLLQSTAVYNRTYSSAPNMVVQSTGTIGRSTSASKYKLNITEINEAEDMGMKLLTVTPKYWFDKHGSEMAAMDITEGGLDDIDPITLRPHYGLIAEDLRGAGLDAFISTNYDTGEIEGIEYDRLWVTLIPLVKQLTEKNVMQEIRLNKMERQLEGMLNG